MNLSDLAPRIRRGDRDAITRLVAAYGAPLYRQALQKTGDPALSREAALQTLRRFIAALQANADADGYALCLDVLGAQAIESCQSQRSELSPSEEELQAKLFDAPAPAPMPRRTVAKPMQRPAQPTPVQRTAPAQPVPKQPAPKRRAAKPRPAADAPTELFEGAGKQKGGALAVVLLLLVTLFLLWAIAGVAMSLNWLPNIDLGYEWFNSSIYRLF